MRIGHTIALGFPLASLALTVSPRAIDSQVSCNILVKAGSTDLGYISPVWNEYGEYGTLQPSATNALEVGMTYDSASPQRINGLVSNSPAGDFPMFGGVLGFSTDDNDLNSGSINYAYIAGTTKTSPGSTATAGPNSFTDETQFDASFQSAIWKYNPTTHGLTAQWINSDSSAVETHILYAEDEKTLFIAGDPAAFSDATSTSYPEVTFACVPKP